MTRTIKACLVFWALPVFSFAQQNLSAPQIFLHFNPLGLIDVFDANASVGGEYIFKPRWSAGLDGGYIYKSAYVRNVGASGFLVRPFGRYYLKPERHSYLQLELHYKNVSYQQEGWITREVNGVSAYQEFSRTTWKKNATGFHLIYGTSATLSRNKRLRIEAYAGLGLRWKNQGNDKNSYETESGFWTLTANSGHSTFFVFPSGLRLAYKIW